MNLRATDTVSEIVSENSGGVMKNGGELSQIVIDFIGDFAIFLALHRTFQVAAQLCPPPASRARAVFQGPCQAAPVSTNDKLLFAFYAPPNQNLPPHS
jgi:hypothetical protein